MTLHAQINPTGMIDHIHSVACNVAEAREGRDEGEAGRCVGTFRAGALKRFGKAAVDFLRSVAKEHSGGDRAN